MLFTLVVFLAGCTGAESKAQCDRVINALCQLQGPECSVYNSFEECEANIRNTQICNPAATDAMYDTCVADLEASNCVNVNPESCGEVLCPAGGAGCNEQTVPGDTSETYRLPTGDTGTATGTATN